MVSKRASVTSLPTHLESSPSRTPVTPVDAIGAHHLRRFGPATHKFALPKLTIQQFTQSCSKLRPRPAASPPGLPCRCPLSVRGNAFCAEAVLAGFALELVSDRVESTGRCCGFYQRGGLLPRPRLARSAHQFVLSEAGGFAPSFGG